MKPKRSVFVVSFFLFLMVGFSGQVGAFSEKDLEKLNATKEYKKCDLSGANLTGADLTEAKLTWANLKFTELPGANLTGTIFCETLMLDESFNVSGC